MSGLDDLAVQLFTINAVKFGNFMTKSGIKSPIYFDLRVIVSYPTVMERISNLLFELTLQDCEYDHLCGVPYTALPIATLLSVQTKKSMLMRRKEAKSYGTKKMIEGHYEAGQTCIIIEDVITSGSSVLETVKDLAKEGLIVKEALIILDREQGGRQNLEENNVQVKSLFTLSKFIEILVNKKKVDEETVQKVKDYLKETQAPKINNNLTTRTSLSFEKRAQSARNAIAKQLFDIMITKKTNLCISIDLTVTSKILDLLENVGEHVCLVKTHIDIIEDFNSNFIVELKQLAKKYNFLILEDRKFADIGNTVSLQYTQGVYKIGEWADCVTVHSLPGEGILKALNISMQSKSGGIFLLAEMSSQGNLLTPDYTEATAKMASLYPDLITGYVCQNGHVLTDPGQIQLSPGVQLQGAGDDLGQVYNTPEQVVLHRGADIAVVGRGIVAAKNPEIQAVIYKDILWKCYLKRVHSEL